MRARARALQQAIEIMKHNGSERERSPALISGGARDEYRIIAGYYRAIDGAL